VGEVGVSHDPVAVIGKPFVERALGYQVATHHTGLEERALGIDSTEHVDLPGRELRACNSARPDRRMLAFRAQRRRTFCSST
jgi:hypothetical protein